MCMHINMYIAHTYTHTHSGKAKRNGDKMHGFCNEAAEAHILTLLLISVGLALSFLICKKGDKVLTY